MTCRKHAHFLAAFILLFALHNHANSAILTGAGGASIRLEYRIDGTTTRVNFVNPLDAEVSDDGTAITAHGAGSFAVSQLEAKNLFDLSTKLSLTTDGSRNPSSLNDFATMTGVSNGSFFIQFHPLDQILDFNVIRTTFEWRFEGEIAPGGRVAVDLGNSLLSQSGVLLHDSQGNPLAYTEMFRLENSGTETLPFSFNMNWLSAAWGRNAGPITSRAGFTFTVSHEPEAIGTTWVGFSDPGTISQVISAEPVPEPSTFAILAILGLGVSFGTARRYFPGSAHRN
jgi:hypothetical protein